MDPGAPLLITLVLLYCVPLSLAAIRNHHNRNAIALLNLLLGWTVLGWIAALIWSCTNPVPAVQAGQPHARALQPADQPARDPTFACPYCDRILYNAVSTCPHCHMKLTPDEITKAVQEYQDAPASASSTEISERLSKLESLKTQGLISNAEYAEKRAAILDEI